MSRSFAKKSSPRPTFAKSVCPWLTALLASMALTACSSQSSKNISQGQKPIPSEPRCADKFEASSAWVDRRVDMFVTIPAAKSGKELRLWVPVPQDSRSQKICEVALLRLSAKPKSGLSMRPSAERPSAERPSAERPSAEQATSLGTLKTEAKYGNRMLYLATPSSKTDQHYVLQFRVLRRAVSEQAKSQEAVSDRDTFLKANALVPIDGEALTRATKIVGQSKGQEALRKLFEATFDHMSYDKSGQGWGRGSFAHACVVGKGNCTDFHAYFISLCRALGTPARFEIGMPFKPEAKTGALTGYHCWAFAELNNQWFPVDISEADKHPKDKDSYFGQLAADRVALSTGRDLTLEPAQAGGPLNYFVHPYAERDGEAVKLGFECRYQRMN